MPRVLHGRPLSTTSTLPRVPEKAIQSQGVALLRNLGGWVYVIGHPSPNDGRKLRGTGQTAGLPDVVAFLPPRPQPEAYGKGELELAVMRSRPTLLFWEAKSAGGRLRPEQRQFRDLCLDAEVAHVTGDLDALIAWLDKHQYVDAAKQFPFYRQPKETKA